MFDVLGDGGSVKYDGVGKLTLNNATINGTDYALRTRVSKPLEIEVIGSCKNLPWTSDFDKIVPIDPVEDDLDGDGEVTIYDAEVITDYLLGEGNIDTEAADIDGDGEVTIADVTAIIQKIIEE